MSGLSGKLVQRSSDALFVQQENETAVFNTKTSRYFALDELGTFIWNCLEKPVTVEQITSSIMQEYDIDEHTCAEDTEHFLLELQKASIVVIQ